MSKSKVFIVKYSYRDDDFEFYDKTIFVTEDEEVAKKYCEKFIRIVKKWQQIYYRITNSSCVYGDFYDKCCERYDMLSRIISCTYEVTGKRQFTKKEVYIVYYYKVRNIDHTLVELFATLDESKAKDYCEKFNRIRIKVWDFYENLASDPNISDDCFNIFNPRLSRIEDSSKCQYRKILIR